MEQKNIFENIKHLNWIGQEYWSGRELFKILNYLKWDKFLNVVDKAKEACRNSGQDENDHFPRVEKMVEIDPDRLICLAYKEKRKSYNPPIK